MKIIPAILANKKEEFVRLLKEAEKFSDYNQIDIMDGVFVPSRSITPQQLEGIYSSVASEAHLMVEDPLLWVEPFFNFGARRIFFHFEIKKNKDEVIEKIRSKGISVGLAINPSTSIQEIFPFLDRVDAFLFMTVNPGFYGARFLPEVKNKIKDFRRRFPSKLLGVDGGIKLSNIKEVVSLGVDFICVGSAIFKEENPALAYSKFKEALKLSPG